MPTDSERAARLMDLLGLSEEELCRLLDADPLTLLSGQVEDRPQLPILLDLAEEARERVGPTVLKRWVRTSGAAGRPIDSLMRRDLPPLQGSLPPLSERGVAP